jgi:hypothetical protein
MLNFTIQKKHVSRDLENISLKTHEYLQPLTRGKIKFLQMWKYKYRPVALLNESDLVSYSVVDDSS